MYLLRCSVQYTYWLSGRYDRGRCCCCISDIDRQTAAVLYKDILFGYSNSYQWIRCGFLGGFILLSSCRSLYLFFFLLYTLRTQIPPMLFLPLPQLLPCLVSSSRRTPTHISNHFDQTHSPDSLPETSCPWPLVSPCSPTPVRHFVPYPPYNVEGEVVPKGNDPGCDVDESEE